MRYIIFVFLVGLIGLLVACDSGDTSAVVPSSHPSQKADHWVVTAPAVIASGYDKFTVQLRAEDVNNQVVSDYQGIYPDAKLFFLSPWRWAIAMVTEPSFEEIEWHEGVATLQAHFHRGIFAGEQAPAEGYVMIDLDGDDDFDNDGAVWMCYSNCKLSW